MASINTTHIGQKMPIPSEAPSSTSSSPEQITKRFGDAGPLGLSAFAFTTFLMAMVNLSAHGVTVPNIIIGPAIAYGGICQLVAGMWDMANGDTLSATISSSYGCFWISFAIILIPGFHVADAYPTVAEYNHAVGLFMLGFFIFSIAITLCLMKSTVAFLTLGCLVNLTWLSTSVAYLYTDEAGSPNAVLVKVSGVSGLLVAITAWYLMYTGLANRSNSFVVAPKLPLPWNPNA